MPVIETFKAGRLEQERIAYHEEAIRSLQVGIAEMEGGELKHYCEGPDGRLNFDETPRMLEVAAATVEGHRL